MKYFLLLIILGVCGASYYEITELQQKNADDLQQIIDLNGKIDGLQTEINKLADEKTALAKSLIDAQKSVAGLTTQVQAAQAGVPAGGSPPGSAAITNTVPLPSLVVGNDLGTIVTTDGKTFANCQLLKVQADGITFKHSQGITKIMFPVLPSDLQRKFGFDPLGTGSLSANQVATDEEARKSAGSMAGH